MINKAKTSMRKGNMGFGIIIPKNVKEALEHDRINGSNYRAETIVEEYHDVKVEFLLEKKSDKIPPIYQKITCHLIFEVKFDLRRKARDVAGGHLTFTPTSIPYSSAVSRESVQIVFLIAALNGLEVWAADIQNAYLNTPTKEKFGL